MVPVTAPMPLLKFTTVQRVPASGSTAGGGCGGAMGCVTGGGWGGATGCVTLIVTCRNCVEPSVRCTRIS